MPCQIWGVQIKALVESVQPFDQLMFKSHHRVALSSARRRGLEVIDRCGRQLLQELRLNGQATGLDINIQVRVASTHTWPVGSASPERSAAGLQLTFMLAQSSCLKQPHLEEAGAA